MIDQIELLLKTEFPEKEILILENYSPPGIQVSATDLSDIMNFLHTNPNCYFDHLACLSGVDNGPEQNTMEIVYTLYSIPLDLHLTIKVMIDRKNPVVPSVASIWRGANWHEREAYDLLGIHFEGHPDLRRILLPADWVGHPMRKDYKEDLTYHGMTIKHPDLLKE